MKNPQYSKIENNFPNFDTPTTFYDYNALHFYVLYIIISLFPLNYFNNVTQWNKFYFNFVYVIRDLAGNNSNSIANCMVYLAKENLINLTLSHNQSRIMSLKEAMQGCILIIKNIKQIVF